MIGRRIIILHSFIKKMQQTPDLELKIARRRLTEINRG
jgi:phage-related protein